MDDTQVPLISCTTDEIDSRSNTLSNNDLKGEGGEIYKPDLWEKTNDQRLFERLDANTQLFLFFSGVNENYYHYHNKLFRLLHQTWNYSFIFFSLLTNIIVVIINFVISSTTHWNFLGLLFAVVILAQFLSLVVSTYWNLKRLYRPAHSYEIPQYSGSLNPTLFVLLIFLVSSGATIPIFMKAFRLCTFPVAVLWTICIVLNLGTCSLFAVSVLFIFVDVKTSSYLIQYLIHEHQANRLTLKLLLKVKQEIKHRVKAHEPANNALMIVALINALFVIIIAIAYKNLLNDVIFILAMTTAFLREVIFVLVGFWEGAKVNELSDELIVRLSKSVPDEELDYLLIEENNNSSSLLLNERNNNNNDLMMNEKDREFHRMTLYTNALSDPISFPLAGMRLTRKDILIRFSLWVSALIIGLIQQDDL
jgi:hypothetical protein